MDQHLLHGHVIFTVLERGGGGEITKAVWDGQTIKSIHLKLNVQSYLRKTYALVYIVTILYNSIGREWIFADLHIGN